MCLDEPGCRKRRTEYTSCELCDPQTSRHVPTATAGQGTANARFNNGLARRDWKRRRDLSTVTGEPDRVALNLRVGGICLLAGAVLISTVRLPHGDTPAAEAEAA